MSSLSIDRKEPRAVLRTTLGNADVLPLNAYLPPYEITPSVGISCHLAASFTPTGTSVTVNPTADDAITFTNGTAREYICLNGHVISDAKHVRAGARRKPGTTGAIVAQTVTFTINSVELGRFTVLAADASTDPISGSIEIVTPAGDSRWGLVGRDLTIGVTAADADLEIFFSMSGDD